jgi:hypothetical protein
MFNKQWNYKFPCTFSSFHILTTYFSKIHLIYLPISILVLQWAIFKQAFRLKFCMFLVSFGLHSSSSLSLIRRPNSTHGRLQSITQVQSKHFLQHFIFQLWPSCSIVWVAKDCSFWRCLKNDSLNNHVKFKYNVMNCRIYSNHKIKKSNKSVSKFYDMLFLIFRNYQVHILAGT